MWKLSHFAFSLVAAAQRVIERRFTRAGMVVGGALIAAAALGVDTQQTIAYRIFALAAALIAVAMIGAFLQRGSYAVRRALPRVVTAGERFNYRIAVSNLGKSPRDGLALLEDLADPRPGFAEFRARLRFPTYRAWKRLIAERITCEVDEIPLPAIAPGATVEIAAHGEALRRGSQHFRGLTVARADPLGLFRGLSRHAQGANLLVLPRRYALPRVVLPGTRKYQPGGVALAASVGNSEEFVSLRDYRPGDPLQRIHWKSFARAGEPIVREYQDEFFERHALVLDTFAGAGRARAFEEAVSIAASFACTVNTQECLLDLMFAGTETYCYTAGRGQMPSGSLLEILAGVQACGTKPFRVLHDAVLARRAALTGGICLLLAWDDARTGFIRALRALGLPLLVIVVTAAPATERAPWLHFIEPGKVQEGLAHL
ncbi:MAG: DUF58 domain-containing protein [Betaproteobacteria bacterium]|nr:DUF58 domain-containing protein [Betaproteobacteria bacterium]